MRLISISRRFRQWCRRLVLVDEMSPAEAADWLLIYGFSADAAWLRRQAARHTRAQRMRRPTFAVRVAPFAR